MKKGDLEIKYVIMTIIALIVLFVIIMIFQGIANETTGGLKGIYDSFLDMWKARGK